MIENFSGITNDMVKRYTPMVYRIAGSRPNWGCLAMDERVSAGHIGILVGYKTYNPERGKLSNWIYLNIWYAILEEVKGRIRRFERERPFGGTRNHAFEKQLVADIFERFDEAMCFLPPLERRVLTALFVDGKSRWRVAKDEGISMSNLYNIRNRALRRIRPN